MHIKEKEYFPAIDLLRFLMITFTVMLHIHPSACEASLGIVRIAVPTLFIISGFLLSSNQGNIPQAKIIKALKKMLSLFIIAQSLYIVDFSLNSYFLNPTRLHSYLQAPGNLSNIILIGDNVAPHLWYLNTYIFALIILYIANILKCKKFLYIISLLAYSIGLFVGTYNFLSTFESQIITTWSLHRNVFTIAIPSIMIGANLHRVKLSAISLVISLLIILVLAWTEGIIILNKVNKEIADYYLLSLPAATILTTVILRIKLHAPYITTIAMLLRRCSLNLFLWHIIVQKFVEHIELFYQQHAWVKLLFTIIFTIIVSELIRLLAQKSKKFFSKKSPKLLRI